MFDRTIFSYLEKDDRDAFVEHFGTAEEFILVGGRATMNRLKTYLSENEFYRIRIIMTALVRDFKIPPVRYMTAIVLVLYNYMAKNISEVREPDQSIVSAELGLLLKHLQKSEYDEEDSEKDRFDRDVVTVLGRWDEYLGNPTEFVL